MSGFQKVTRFYSIPILLLVFWKDIDLTVAYKMCQMSSTEHLF